MTAPTLTDYNRAVRSFARQHRILTTTREDGELALRVGRRRKDPESHATLVRYSTPRLWRLYLYNATGFTAAALERAGATEVWHLDDDMVAATIPEADLLRVAGVTPRSQVVVRPRQSGPPRGFLSDTAAGAFPAPTIDAEGSGGT